MKESMTTATATKPVKRSTWMTKARFGTYYVWLTNTGNHVVTDGYEGEIIATRTEFKPASDVAKALHGLKK